MLGWLTRLFTPPEPAPPRLSTRVTILENLADDLDARVDYLAAELKKVRGRQFALEKSRQDDVETTNGDGEEEVAQQPATRFSTAHLARRFRGG